EHELEPIPLAEGHLGDSTQPLKPIGRHTDMIRGIRYEYPVSSIRLTTRWIMSDRSGIEWTETTWNPTTGCDRVSAGCDNCYALALARRLKAMGQAKYQRDGDPRTSGPGFGLTTHADALRLPYSWSSPRIVFVNSMSDLFHAKVPAGFVAQVFSVIADTPQHTYQVLTKRSARLRKIAGRLDWPPNLWMGVSVEDSDALYRV